MTRTDDNHKVARIIKGLEERIANLEETDRSASIPNLLRTKTDRVVVNDVVATVTQKHLQTARWNDTTTSDRGYQTEGYQEGGYGGYSATDDSGDTTTTVATGWNEGGYSYGPYGGDVDDYGEGEFGGGGYGGNEEYGDYGEGDYGAGDYGGPDDTSDGGGDGGGDTISDRTLGVANTGWHTGTWGAYKTSGANELTVATGETHLISTGEVETYTAATIDGTLEADGVLETE